MADPTAEPLCPEPPIPADLGERARWDHTRLRRRILRGQWRDDLVERIVRTFGNVRAEAIGDPDMSSNVLGQTSGQLSSLYDRHYAVRHENVAAAAEIQRQLRLAQHGPLMQRGQRDCIGLREMLLRVDVVGVGKDARLVLRPVYPDHVIAEPDRYNPARAAVVREARLRREPGSNKPIWTWDVVDWRDPSKPSYRILDAEQRLDLSSWYLGRAWGLQGPDYPAWDGHQGVPLYVVYHAATTSQLWDPWFGSELVDGTLQLGVLWTFFGHGVRNASWPQRYILDADVVGAAGEDENRDGAGRDVVDVDPTSVLKLFSTHDQRQAIISQWAAGVDPDKLITAVSQYERRVAAFAGIDDSDFVRMSGDPRSGYALAISREGKREAARKYEPTFRSADEELFRICAVLLNRAGQGAFHLPTDGYQIEYQGIPMSQDEAAKQQTRLLELVDRGWMSDAQGMAELFQISVTEAERRLTENRAARIGTGRPVIDAA